MKFYNPREYETKWQKKWLENKVSRARNPGDDDFDPQQKPFYVLDMFPYPSGAGLHVGHTSGYIGTDIVARKKRMQNFNVLHPMGWDAFGLPAEQYAIQTGQHPRQTTDVNTATFRKQLQLIGLSYDWDREIDTSHPSYYRWTQWIFLQLYKKGLVYRKEMPVWWCEELKTVLANEEVINGRSERGNFPCERRPLTQWVFKITEFADRLLEDLKELNWPVGVLKMQEDWIGKSYGALIRFPLIDENDAIEVFTTRPDTVYGVSALVLAPEHPFVASITKPENKQSVEAYKQKAGSKSDRERKAEAKELTGADTGAKVKHPLTGELIPVWIADYVLADYGTGAVMAVPSHDERDFLLAKTVGLSLKPVIAPEGKPPLQTECFSEDGALVNSGPFTGLSSVTAREQIANHLEEKGLGSKKTTYKIRDWIFSRQRYWGEPFPLYLNEEDQVVAAEELDLPIELPPMQNFEPSADGSSPLARLKDWVELKDKSGRKLFRVTDTMPGWAGSCWYYLRFMDPSNTQQAFSVEAVNYWKQVDLYVGGASHAVMHLLYSRFWHKALFDLKLVPTKEPFARLFNQGMITAFAFRDTTGRLVPSDEVEAFGNGYRRKSDGSQVEKMITKMAKSLRNVVRPDDVIEARGCDTFRLYVMFMGPLADEKPWADENISGCEKFLKRLWTEIQKCLLAETAPTNEQILRNTRSLHKCLKRVDDSFENLNFNTSVAAFMECLNEIQETGDGLLQQDQIKMFMQMLFPFAPHFASEIWEQMGQKAWIDFSEWPKLNSEYLVQSEFEMVIQINGKIRKKKMVPIAITQEQALQIARSELGEAFPDPIKKVIFVPKKLLNIVV